MLLVIIGILLWHYSINNPDTDSFQDFVMPKPNPQPLPIAKGDPRPFSPRSTALLSPPPGQTASVNSYPADDPAQKKADAKRINGVLETLNGFLKNEGPGLEKLGDPAVQIPLQTARADARRLADESSVMKRNPGVESSLSEMNVYDIEANLTYLQKKWRLSVNSMSGVEGFQSEPSGSTSGFASGSTSGFASGSVSGFASGSVSGSALTMIAINPSRPQPTSSTYNYKGIIPDFPSLPPTGNTLNDYYIIDLNFNVFQWNIYALWDGSRWVLQGFPTFSVVDTVRDIRELSNMTYNDFVEGSVYKMYDKFGPYTVYLAWMGGRPGPANAPQDIINMMEYVYNQPNNNAYGPGDVKTGSAGAAGARFRFIATNTTTNINTLINDIAKTPNFIGRDIGTVQSISTLPLTNNLNNDNGVIQVSENKQLYVTWRGNCWVGDVNMTTPNVRGPSPTPNVRGPSPTEPFQNPSTNPIIVTPELLAFFTNLLRPSTPSGAPSGPSPSGTPSPTGTSGSANITVAQLNTLQTNILATITRLTASGSTNPLLQQRVSTLERVLASVNSYVTQVNNGTLKPADIPISLASYNKFLPFVDPTKSLNINDPLPNLIVSTGASSALMNLFPYFMGGDVSGVDLARQLFDKYAKSFFSDTSYEIGLKFNHKSESERRLAESVAKSMINPVVRPFGDDNQENHHGNAPSQSGSRGELEKNTIKMTGSTNGKTSSSSTSAEPGHASSTPATMDWKARSEQICSQISKRGMNPNDYGCLKSPTDVDENFSFRGHARMICSRLGTNYDPGIPDLCGCPPPTWPGWRP